MGRPAGLSKLRATEIIDHNSASNDECIALLECKLAFETMYLANRSPSVEYYGFRISNVELAVPLRLQEGFPVVAVTRDPGVRMAWRFNPDAKIPSVPSPARRESVPGEASAFRETR